MAKEVEGTFLADGKSLYTKSWLPESSPPRASLVFVHGFSDHINRYYGLFPHLAAQGIAVHGFDQRGWGRSVAKPGEKGLTGPTSRVIADMAGFIKPYLPAGPEEPPLFVMGHSMGGQEVLTLMCDPAYKDVVERVRGWLCEAPFIGFSPGEQPSAVTVFVGRLAGKVLPRRKMVHVIPPENLSRDPEVVKSLAADELLHNTGTLEGLSGMLDRTEALSAGRVRAPGYVRSLWFGHGTEDKGTDYGQTKKWFEGCTGEVKDKEMKTYEGHYHQLHADFGKEEFYEDVARWILERCEPEKKEVVPEETKTTSAPAPVPATAEAKL